MAIEIPTDETGAVTQTPRDRGLVIELKKVTEILNDYGYVSDRPMPALMCRALKTHLDTKVIRILGGTP